MRARVGAAGGGRVYMLDRAENSALHQPSASSAFIHV